MMCWTMVSVSTLILFTGKKQSDVTQEEFLTTQDVLVFIFRLALCIVMLPICFWGESPCCVCAEWWNNSCRREGEEPLSREAQSYCRRGKDGFREKRLSTDEKCSKYSSGKEKNNRRKQGLEHLWLAFANFSGIHMYSIGVWHSATTYSDLLFFSEEECFLDRNSKIAPIAVCLSILGLFVIVFATFLISRRKPHRGYQRIWGALVLPNVCSKQRSHRSFCFCLAISLPWSHIFKWNDTMCLQLMNVSGRSFFKVERRELTPTLGYS